MNRTMVIFLGGTALSAGMAHAEVECAIPMANWQPRGAVVEKAVENGWDVKRIKIDDGCYEVYATDSDGRVFEIKLRPDTLEMVEMQYDDHDSDGNEDDD